MSPNPLISTSTSYFTAISVKLARMETLLEELSTQHSLDRICRTLQQLLGILNCLSGDASRYRWRNLSISMLDEDVTKLLLAGGYVVHGPDLMLPAEADMSMIDSAICLAESILDSCGEDRVFDYDAELKDAIWLSLESVDLHAQKMEAPVRLPNESGMGSLSEQVTVPRSLKPSERLQHWTLVEFRRNEESHMVFAQDENTVATIETTCKQSAAPYIDQYFPHDASSLYVDAADADKWQCTQCSKLVDLPSTPVPGRTKKEDREQNEFYVSSVGVCPFCGSTAPSYVADRYFFRPAQWLRAGSKCDGCSLMYEELGGKEMAARMCSHYLRDSFNQTIGQSWRLFRGDPEPEDVIQGNLGNCWFAGALSIVARMPSLVKRLFKSDGVSRTGAYYVRLCCSGYWRGIIVDDWFPTTILREGSCDGTNIYYAQGGNLCYLSCARRQLWAPILEKAAAKVYGCYASLESGTFSEALAMLTGYPTERLQLYVPQRQLLDNITIEDDDLTWARILSAVECGFLIGLGCSAEICEKSVQKVVDMGLQSPHAYGVLDAREVKVKDGIRPARLLKVRNPQGERAPRTWKGAWGKESSEWTPDMLLELGPNFEDKSVFWISFDDVKEYFPFAEICRVHENWQETRQQILLPYAMDPGEALDLVASCTTQIDVAVWQERHFAAGGRTINADIGLAVLRKRGLGCPVGKPDQFDLLHYLRRTRADEVSGEIMLEAGFVYRLVPLSFVAIPEGDRETVARRATVSVHSVHPVNLSPTASSWNLIARAVFDGCCQHGSLKPLMGDCPHDLRVLQLKEDWGVVLVAENSSNIGLALQIHVADSTGCNFSRSDARDSGIMVAVRAQSQQVLLALTPTPGAKRCSMKVEVAAMSGVLAAFAEVGDGLHMTLPWQASPQRLPPPLPVKE